MESKQKINCNVKSCIYNTKEKCALEEITVEPCPNCSSAKEDESMCGSYEANTEDEE